MKELNEVLELLRMATPMLKEFITWKQEQAEQQKREELRQSEARAEFEKWIAAKRKREAQESQDADRLAESFYGEKRWMAERFAPRRY